MATRPRGTIGALLRRLARKVWVRATLFAVIAVSFALAAGVVGALVPFRLEIELGQNSVGSILQIIATAMLTATTFSITAMVTAYSSATTIATPRSTQLLIADPTSQNALSTFVGAFVFSMVGIIALSTGYYTEQGRTILFLGTLVVVAMIVVTLMRWIGHLAEFGRMADVIDRVERAAATSLAEYASAPTLGARPFVEVPDGAVPVWADEIAFVTLVDVAAIDRQAREAGIDVYVAATPGRMADRLHPLAHVSGAVDDATLDAVRDAFRLAPHRDYEQDPRLGVIALAEIGSRALSPSTNDPGTAIEVISAFQRVFTSALVPDEDPAVLYENVWIQAPRLDTLVTDAFRPLARDGAAIVEVQIRLQKCLAGLAATSSEHRGVFTAAGRDAAVRAKRAMHRDDFRIVRTAMRDAWGRTPR